MKKAKKKTNTKTVECEALPTANAQRSLSTAIIPEEDDNDSRRIADKESLDSVIKADKKYLEDANKTPFEKHGNIELSKLGAFKFFKGKNKDKTFIEVFNSDKGYVNWILKNNHLISSRSNTYLFYKYVERMRTGC